MKASRRQRRRFAPCDPRRRALAAAVAIGAAGALACAAALAQPGPATGDAARGERLFGSTYKCYACHGFDAQTGQRRLVPTNYTEEGFITFVQNSPLPLMPMYADVPDRDLADIYAYIRSIPIDAPPIEEVPLLESILEKTRETMAQ